MTDNVHRFAQRFAMHRERLAHIQMPDTQSSGFDFLPVSQTTGDAAGTQAHPTLQVAYDGAPGALQHLHDAPYRAVPSAGPDVPRRGSVVRGMKRVFLLLVVLGLGWTVYSDPTRVVRWGAAANTALAPIVKEVIDETLPPVRPASYREPSDKDGRMATASTSPTSQLVETAVQAVKPGTAKQSATQQTVPASGTTVPPKPKLVKALPPVHVISKSTRDEKAPIAEHKRYLSRAQAGGLHPKLSRALLAELSNPDFKNAAYAIRTAVAKTPDEATFKWPRKRQAGLAIFEVHFVPGAAKGCRRYVVTIEKKRWLTIALPMEKCRGVKMARAAAGR